MQEAKRRSQHGGGAEAADGFPCPGRALEPQRQPWVVLVGARMQTH